MLRRGVISSLRQARLMTTNTMHGPLPVIDFGDFINSKDPKVKKEVAKKVDAACRDIGFMLVVNHGVPQDVIDTAWKETRAFFDQPAEVKSKGMEMTPDYPYGYIGFKSETLSAGRAVEDGTGGEAPPDLNESVQIGPSNPAAGMPPIKWPVSPPGFRPAWEAYYKEMEGLASNILRSFALGLDLPENWFEDKIDRHRSALRALNYPDIDGFTPVEGQLRASAHSDYGSLTILRGEDTPGGLQVMVRNKGYVDVHPLPDAFIINIGDLMQRWTNDVYVSTLHRVVVPPQNMNKSCRRQSMAFFQNINADAMVEAIPSCVTADRPAKYPPISAFDHLMEKHRAATK